MEFGFSENVSLVYVYLLKAGTAVGGSSIAAGTSLHRQYVYLTLPQLIDIGLVEEVPHGKRLQYKAKPPIELEKIGRKRSVLATDLAYDLNIISAIGNTQDFEVIQGVKAIQQYEMSYAEQADADEYEYIIGGASERFIELMGTQLDEYLYRKQKAGVQVHYLGSRKEADAYVQQTGKYTNQKFRFLEHLPNGVSHMVIRKSSVSFFSFLTPPLVYVVQSTVLAENYTQFFMMLWGMASEKKVTR